MQGPVCHQCVIYQGSPAKHLGGLASLITRKLRANNRCLYLNSRTMVDLAAGGLNVEQEVKRGALPPDAIRDALYTHEAVHISETLMRINPYYARRHRQAEPLARVSAAEVQQMLGQLQQSAQA